MKIINVVAFEESVLFNVNENVPAYKADENGAKHNDNSFHIAPPIPDLISTESLGTLTFITAPQTVPAMLDAATKTGR